MNTVYLKFVNYYFNNKQGNDGDDANQGYI